MATTNDWLAGDDAVRELAKLTGTKSHLINMVSAAAACSPEEVTLLEGVAEILLIIPAHCDSELGAASKVAVNISPAHIRIKMYALDAGKELDIILSTFQLGGIGALCVAHEALLLINIL